MDKYLNKFYDIVDKIGKQNFILITFIFIVLITTGLYQTFSLYTESGGLSLIDGVKTYSFILNASNTTNSVTIAAGSSKNLDITVANESATTLLYGLYYSSSNSLDDVNIGYLSTTSSLPSGTIEANSNNIVTIKIFNNSTSSVTINFGLKYGFENRGDLTLDTGQYWLEVFPILASYVQNLYNDGSTITTAYIGGDSANPTVSLNATQGIMLDNNGEYRYYGDDPNNYVSFNGELWRIISSSNVKSSTTDTTGELRVKLVKTTELMDDNGKASFYWDGHTIDLDNYEGENDWSVADLKNALNNVYYNSGSGTCYLGNENDDGSCIFTNNGLSTEARNLVSSALYNLGGIATDLSSIYADDLYNSERGTIVWPNSGNTCSDGACPRTTTWVGNVGLMYASDYAYGADLSVCTQTVFNYNSDDSCYIQNWLYFLDPDAWVAIWFMNPVNDEADHVLTTGFDGSIYSEIVYTTDPVYPTVYLKSGVVVTGGTGTSTDPYQLALG